MRIIIVADPYRKDFYDYLVETLSADNEIFLLWEYRNTGKIYPFPGKIIPVFWSSFHTPAKLIKSLKPDRIIFFEIIDLWQIALIISCHQFNVSSFFLEHGVGNSTEQVIKRFKENPSFFRKVKNYFNRVLFSIKAVTKGRVFLFSSLSYLTREERKKIFELLGYFKKYTPIQALSLAKFRKRTPHFAVLFNENNIAPFLLYNEIEPGNIYTGGVPFFDKYFHFSKLPKKDHIVFIEHPYLEEGILKWNKEFHERVARTLERFSIETGRRIIVKLHPRSRMVNWTRYNLGGQVEIKQAEDVTADLITSKLILGYSSTLINAMIACRKNIVLLGWHPTPHIYGDDVSKTGLCHVSFDPDELIRQFQNWHNQNLTESNEKAYLDFIKEYNYPFDGNATNRIVDFILGKNISQVKSDLVKSNSEL